MQLVGCHPQPTPGQAEKLLRKLEGCLQLQLLQGCPVKLQEELDEVLEDEMGRPGQALMKGSRVGLGESISARGWHCSERARLWSEQRRPWCMPSSLLGSMGSRKRCWHSRKTADCIHNSQEISMGDIMICWSGGADVLGPTESEVARGTGGVEEGSDIGSGAVIAGAVDTRIWSSLVGTAGGG